MTRSQVAWLGLAALLFSGATTWNATGFDHDTEVRHRWQVEVVTLPRPEVAKRLVFGYQSIVADYYWIRALQYYGHFKNFQIGYAQLPDFIDLVVGLEPRFNEVYRFGGLAIPWNSATGWKNVDRAVRVLEQGVREYPDDWKLHVYLAYDYSSYLHRFKDAGDQLALAAKLPGAPSYCAPLATRMYVTSGDVEGAEAFAQALLSSTDDERMRKVIGQRLIELRSKEVMAHLDKAIADFRTQRGQLPARLQDLVTAGIIDRVPPDPLGGNFTYDPATGSVRSPLLSDPLTVFEKKKK